MCDFLDNLHFRINKSRIKGYIFLCVDIFNIFQIFKVKAITESNKRRIKLTITDHILFVVVTLSFIGFTFRIVMNEGEVPQKLKEEKCAHVISSGIHVN